MQSSYYGMDHLDQLLLQEEWERMPRSTPRAARAKQRSDSEKPVAEQPTELSPVIAVMPGLIRLINECSDRPIEKLRPTIKRLILEQVFMEVGGDSIVDAQHMMQVKEYVELTVRVLVRIRRRDRSQYDWSDTPVTPQMFG
jgi:hypothetical protein